jgi:hypothetical protein
MTKLCDDKTVRQLHYLKNRITTLQSGLFLVPAGRANRLQDYWHFLCLFINLIITVIAQYNEQDMPP